MRKTILTLALLVIGPLLFAQQTLNNDAVIKLVKAGLSDDLIVTTINAKPGTYDTSADGLIALKAAGVSDKVVSAIVQKKVEPGYLGIGVNDVTPDNARSLKLPDATGAVVAEVEPDSPASRGGLLAGDVISQINGEKLLNATALKAAMSKIAPGTAITVGIFRDGKPITLNVTVDQFHGNAAGPALATMFPTGPAAPISDDPADPHDPGVYMLTTGQDGKQKMVLIHEIDPAEANLGVGSVLGMAFSYGIAKSNITAEIPGPHADVRTQVKAPVFYMYFPTQDYLNAHAIVQLGTTSTIFGAPNAVTVAPAKTMGSPTQFFLLPLEDKKKFRQLTIGKLSVFKGEKDDLDNGKTIKFKAETISSYVYKVTPETDLKPGEYAFVAATGEPIYDPSAQVNGNDLAAGGIAVFDFGVDPN
jgi:PDZ domain-containing protein